jgi:predicted secreted protein
MATKVELIQKVEEEAEVRKIDLKITGIGIAVNREQTTAVYEENGRVILGRKGKNAIEDFVSRSGIPVYCVAGIREIVTFLYEEQVPVLIEKERMALDEKRMLIFDEYLRTYGTD